MCAADGPAVLLTVSSYRLLLLICSDDVLLAAWANSDTQCYAAVCLISWIQNTFARTLSSVYKVDCTHHGTALCTRCESICAIQEEKDLLHIGDVQLRLTPLEEVFMAVAREAEIKHAEHMHETIELMLNGGPVLQASALALGR